MGSAEEPSIKSVQFVKKIHNTIFVFGYSKNIKLLIVNFRRLKKLAVLQFSMAKLDLFGMVFE